MEPQRRTGSITIESVVDYARSVLAQAREIDIASAAQSRVSLPFLDVRVASFDPDMAHAVEHNFVQATDRTPAGPLPGGMDVLIAHPEAAGMPPPIGWDGSLFYEPQRISETLERAGLQGSYFYDLDHWHIYDLSDHRAVQLMRGPGQYPPWEPGAPLRPFLHWRYAQAGKRLAHCGTVGLDGKGVMLGGAGGSGKSGAVIASLLHGLQSVGDDYVLLDIGERVEAYPIFSILKQDPAGFQRLGLGRRLPAELPLNWQGKHQFRIFDVTETPVPSNLTIGALLLPRVAGEARSGITPVGRSEAMIALAASSIQQMPGDREGGFRFFSDVVRRLPSYRLELGPDPKEVAETIGNFISGLPR